MNIKQAKIKNMLIDVSDCGKVFRCAFTDSRGRQIPRRELSQWDSHGYKRVSIGIDGHQYKFFVHRLVAQCFSGNWSEALAVDHINGDRADNRAGNLRVVSTQGNAMAGRSVSGEVPYRGVRLMRDAKRSKPYRAGVTKDGKFYRVGDFDTAESAARARDKVAASLGFLSEGLNFPALENI